MNLHADAALQGLSGRRPGPARRRVDDRMAAAPARRRAVRTARRWRTSTPASVRGGSWRCVFAVAVTTGAIGSILLFALISFLALREFVTLAPTRPGDHRALFWCFFIVTPLQYTLIWIGWYGLFSILIPVYVSIFMAIRTALAGDTERFLERTATTQWGLMICVYFVSYVPALLMLRIPGYEHQNAKLMFFLVLVVQLSDVLQYVWGKTIGKRRIAPSISPNKTWEGFVGGIAVGDGRRRRDLVGDAVRAGRGGDDGARRRPSWASPAA